MAAIIKNRFPIKEFNAQLRVNRRWDHSECLNLLESLTKLGFHDWSASGFGQREIWFYLETKQL